MEKGEKLYCVCQMPYDGAFMVQCDACNDWYHGSCVNLDEGDAEALEIYHCPKCAKSLGPSVYGARITDPHRFAGKEEEEEVQSSNELSDAAKRTISLMRRLRHRPYTNESDAPFIRLHTGSKLNLKRLTKNNFDRPILITQKDDLEMRLPSEKITLEEIQELAGGSTTMLDAIDVLEQKNRKMSFAEFIRYWNLPSRGGKVYNVISLEVSATPLGEMIEAPRVVRELSWVDQFWPADRLDKALLRKSDAKIKAPNKTTNDGLGNRSASNSPATNGDAADEKSANLQKSEQKDDGDDRIIVYEEESNAEDECDKVRLSVDDPNYALLNAGESQSSLKNEDADAVDKDSENDEDKPILAKPRVTKYCLMSAKGSFTDFHVDFGGTSVWYHVLRGEKLFYLIPPTSKSIKLYEQWMCTGQSKVDAKNRESFLCDQAPICYRLRLKQGNTVLLPSGWIHAVYTPVDSLVFGGNFLNFFSAESQIAVYDMEKRLRTPAKFMFPNFQTAHWFAADALRNRLFERISVRESVDQYLVNAAHAICEALRKWTKSKEDYKFSRQFIPDSIDHRDLLNELGHLIEQAQRTSNSQEDLNLKQSGSMKAKLKSKLPICHTSPKPKRATKRDDDDDASVSFDSDLDSNASSTEARRRKQRKLKTKANQRSSHPSHSIARSSSTVTVPQRPACSKDIKHTSSVHSYAAATIAPAKQTPAAQSKERKLPSSSKALMERQWHDLFAGPSSKQVKRDESASAVTKQPTNTAGTQQQSRTNHGEFKLASGSVADLSKNRLAPKLKTQSSAGSSPSTDGGHSHSKNRPTTKLAVDETGVV